MQFINDSPPVEPTRDQQQDALQKGLGRAMQWARSGRLDSDLLLDACLHDLRYDKQLEDNRGEWLWELIGAAGLSEPLRQPLLDALRSCHKEANAYQLCELAYHYAVDGDGESAASLARFVGIRQVPEAPWIGEGQLLALGGLEAFRLIVRIRGAVLAQTEWEWHDLAVVERAEELFGDGAVADRLTRDPDDDIRRFAARWKIETAERSAETPPVRADRTKSRSIDDVLAAARSNEGGYWLRSWGMQASDEDLRTVLDAACASDRPETTAKLLRVFSNRALPTFDSRLLELCRHEHEDVRRWAFNAAAINTDSAIRAFAWQQLQENPAGPAVKLLERNYVSGDEDRVLDAMAIPEEAFPRHSLLMDVLKMLEANPGADCSRLAVVIYANTPCQMCRRGAAALLHDRDVAPPWLIEECADDAEEATRELFGGEQ
ncbi:hypothetical protein Mal4_54170 [Maioricimonas rarisocia]|uniref:Uncharacterized protein n=1 Tax=Maioricimonas rarisocia TaxID=2528026 RepID=A0A517ZF49_9PLAN|nr:hypothetical protein [Maioricimonas rarisocia]QDU41052.1 hypothetical protein Mal4_54170 [Maioricimonas rarisocia]